MIILLIWWQAACVQGNILCLNRFAILRLISWQSVQSHKWASGTLKCVRLNNEQQQQCAVTQADKCCAWVAVNEYSTGSFQVNSSGQVPTLFGAFNQNVDNDFGSAFDWRRICAQDVWQLIESSTSRHDRWDMSGEWQRHSDQYPLTFTFEGAIQSLVTHDLVWFSPVIRADFRLLISDWRIFRVWG